MTTFHEPPPQSRRAARESERAVQTDSAVDYSQPDESATPPSGRRARDAAAEPLTYVTEGGQAPQPAVPAPAPAASNESQGFRIRDYSPEGRRSAAYPSQPAAPTNLDYRTQAGPALEHPAEAQVPAAAWTPPPSTVTGSAQPMTRREARALREAQDAAAAATPLVEPEQPVAPASALSNAMAEFEALARAAQPPVPEVTEPPRTETIGTSEPYTTRIAGPAAASRVDDVPPPAGVFVPPFEAEAVVEPVVEPELDASPSTATDSFASLFSFPAPAAEPIPLVEPEPVAENNPFLSAAPPASTPSFPPPAAPVAPAQPSTLFQQFPAEQPVVDSTVDSVAEPTTEAAPADVIDEEPVAPSEEAAAASAWPFTAMNPTIPEETVEAPISWSPPAWAAPTQDDTEPEPVLRETYTPPSGHWSRQADLDDENDVFENTLTREVGGSNVSTATSALILPNIPQASDFGNLINATGEILITGTIDLPQSLGTMGGDSRRYDDSSVDQMFEAFDGEVVSNDSAPVRAIRAVSTHTSSRGVIQTAKPQSNRALMTAGVITLGVLIVGVVGLLAVYIITTL